MKRLLLGCAVLALSVGCSNGSNGTGGNGNITLVDQDNGATLTTAQKISFTDTITSLEMIDKGGRAAESGRNVGIPKADQMKQALRDANCAVEIVNPGQPPSDRSYDYTYKFNVSGQGCPVSQSAESRVLRTNGQQLLATHKVRYVASDATYAAINDITEISYDDQVDARFEYQTGGVRVEGKGAGKGYLKSTSLGQISFSTQTGISIVGNSNGTTGGAEMITRLEFPGFPVVIRLKQYYEGAEQKLKFYLNGTEISKDEYNRFTNYISLTDADRQDTTLL